MAKKSEKVVDLYKGCYGRRANQEQVRTFVLKNAIRNFDRPDEERFVVNVWGNSGCVFADTKIRIRKVSEKSSHNIIEVKPDNTKTS